MCVPNVTQIKDETGEGSYFVYLCVSICVYVHVSALHVCEYVRVSALCVCVCILCICV